MLHDPAIRNPIAIAFGAVAGALTRHYLTLWFTQQLGSSFPYGTLFINFTGCLAMGFFATIALENALAIPAEIRFLVSTGFLGAYTTFSSYGLESLTLLRDQSLFLASFYWAGSAILGVISVQLGMVLARMVN